MADWFIYSLFSLVSIVFYRIIQKKLISNSNEILFGICESIWTIIFTLPFLFIYGFSFTGSITELILTIIKSCISAIAALLLYKSIKNIEASNFQIISSSSLVITFLSGLLILDEDFETKNLLACIIVISSLLIISVHGQRFKFGKYHFYALISTILFAIVKTFDKFLVDYFNHFTFLFVTFSISQIFKLIISYKNTYEIPNYFKHKSNIFLPMLTGIFLFGIYIFAYFAYGSGGNLSTVNIITSTSTIFIVILSIFLLDDRKFIIKKFIAGLLVFIAMILYKVL